MVEARSEPSPIPAQRKKFTPAKNKPPVIDQSQAKTDAETMDLHRMPLLAARGPDAAPVKRIGSSACREVGGLGDRGSHGFVARSGGALLGFSNVLIVIELLAVGLGGRERSLGARRNCMALVLGDGGEIWIVNRYEDRTAPARTASPSRSRRT